MRKLTFSSRRRFVQDLAASLSLITVPRPLAARQAGRVVTVRIAEFAFVPEWLEIKVGDTVRWVNEDLAPHTATEIDGAWETDSLATGEETRLVFGASGDFDYFCAFHPHMTGSVSVRSNSPG